MVGTGRNTAGLYSYAKECVKNVYPHAEIVWLMFDKDDLRMMILIMLFGVRKPVKEL